MITTPTDALAGPLTGAYYWVPFPPVSSLTWRILTYHELGFGEDISHYEIWPKVVTQLAGIWRRDPKVLRRHLGKHCYGLPRGRVTHPEKTYLILHGNDSPIPDWKARVIRRFNMQGLLVKPLFDEHEQRMGEDARKTGEALGIVASTGNLI